MSSQRETSMRTLITTLLALLTLTTSAMAEPPVRDDEPGWWQAALLIKGTSHRIGFSLWIPPEGDDRDAYVRNADEYIAVKYNRKGDSVTLDFPHHDSRITAEFVVKQTVEQVHEIKLIGEWVKTRSDGRSVMAFEAWRLAHISDFDVQPDYEIKDHKRVVLHEYVYAMAYDESGGAHSTIQWINGQGHFPGIDLEGAIETPTGDYLHLSGMNLRSCQPGIDRVILSAFDGSHAFLFTADIDPTTGDLTNGHFYSGNHLHETFTARRIDNDEEFETLKKEIAEKKKEIKPSDCNHWAERVALRASTTTSSAHPTTHPNAPAHAPPRSAPAAAPPPRAPPGIRIRSQTPQAPAAACSWRSPPPYPQ